MTSETLPCGHPRQYEIFPVGKLTGTDGPCGICRGSPFDAMHYAAELCGVEFRPGELAWAKLVVAEPDGDVPRLVLADWLDEQGDDRGELIRVECEMRRIEDDWDARVPGRYTNLSDRRAALLL